MQTHSRWGLALGMTPNMSISLCRYQHVVIRIALWTQCEIQPTQCRSLQTQRHSQSTQCKLVDYHRVGHHHIGVCAGHVNFMLFVSCFLALGSQHERGFWWNMGLPNFLLTFFRGPFPSTCLLHWVESQGRSDRWGVHY